MRAQSTTEAALPLEPQAWMPPRSRNTYLRAAGFIAIWAVFLGNIVVICLFWAFGGAENNLEPDTTGQLFNSIGRLTGLLSAYLALVQIVLFARMAWFERLVGLDRISVWHRWNGHACLWLLLAHVVFQVWGYAKIEIGEPVSFWREFWLLLTDGRYPGMITATVGTALVVVVTVSSYAIAMRHLPYELWYAVHLTAYAGIALGWFHQIPTGNDLVYNDVAAWYWRGLYIATVALIVWRIVMPLATGLRYRLRVVETTSEGPGVVSLRLSGKNLDRLRVRAGQFFLWRFLAPGFWWTAHPYSISEVPDGGTLRITVKGLGGHSEKIARIRPGTRVAIEGPFGTFTAAARRREKVLLIGGGIGVTPVRALAEEMDGDVVLIYRALTEADLVLSDELEQIAGGRGTTIHYVVGDHATEEGKNLLSPEHLRELVPDIEEREIYLCGPPAMIKAIRESLRHVGVPRRYLHVEKFAL